MAWIKERMKTLSIQATEQIIRTQIAFSTPRLNASEMEKKLTSQGRNMTKRRLRNKGVRTLNAFLMGIPPFYQYIKGGRWSQRRKEKPGNESLGVLFPKNTQVLQQDFFLNEGSDDFK